MRINVTIRVEPDDPTTDDHIEIERCSWGDEQEIAAIAALAAEMTAAAAVAANRETTT